MPNEIKTRKKIVLLSATPVNNDVYDLASQVECPHFLYQGL